MEGVILVPDWPTQDCFFTSFLDDQSQANPFQTNTEFDAYTQLNRKIPAAQKTATDGSKGSSTTTIICNKWMTFSENIESVEIARFTFSQHDF